MNKAEIIRLMAATLLPHTGESGRWSLDDAIRYAEAIYQRTGGDQPAGKYGQRKTENNISQMTTQQKTDFERVWNSYNHKHGKQRAAARWVEINPDKATVERILKAATADAAIHRPQGQVRKYLEGWLADSRWEDYQTQQPTQQDQAAKAMQQIAQELAHAKRMTGMDENSEYWAEQTELLTNKLTQMRKEATS